MLRERLYACLGLTDEVRKILNARLGLISDFVGYEALIDYIDAHQLAALPGDFLEIGAFMGGGSAKLARYAAKYSKRLVVVDVFDPDFDPTEDVHGQSLHYLYRQLLGRKSLRQVFDRNTRFARNIVVYGEDSKRVRLPAGTQLCFSFIDGNHTPEYVDNDFYLAWNLTVPGGVVGFHDYDEGSSVALPYMVPAIRELIAANRPAIRDTCYLRDKAIMLIRKR